MIGPGYLFSIPHVNCESIYLCCGRLQWREWHQGLIWTWVGGGGGGVREKWCSSSSGQSGQGVMDGLNVGLTLPAPPPQPSADNDQNGGWRWAKVLD